MRKPSVSLALSYIVGPSIQTPKTLRVSASNTLDIHLQNQLKPWPQQGKHLFPVPVGLTRISNQLARNVKVRGGWWGVDSGEQGGVCVRAYVGNLTTSGASFRLIADGWWW